MTITELFERRLLFIAGKGGVGKSTIAAALAITAARRGKSVCLVESDGQEQMARLFGTKPVSYEGRSLAPNVRGISITTESALREYVSRHLPLHTISRHLINNRLVRYFLDATPGLKELLVLAKVINLVEDSDDDLVVVDMPATGHGLAMLGVPNVLIEAVHAGPLRRQAEQTYDIINDPSTSAICFVTLAEELASTETVELYKTIRKDMSIAAGPVIANGVHLPLFSDEEFKRYTSLSKQWAKDEELSRLLEGAELAMSRAQLNKRYIDTLENAFKLAPLIVPFLFVEAIDRDALAQISDALASGGAS